jgi:putative redox protein
MTTDANEPSSPHVPVQVEWAGGLQFDASRADGPRIRLDGDYKAGPSPFDALLAAIASCAATDVVTIMEKQRTPLRAFTVRVDSHRVNAVPRRLAAAVLHFSLHGAGITAEKAARAVELSVTKYCSVRSSLLADIPVTWTIDVKN